MLTQTRSRVDLYFFCGRRLREDRQPFSGRIIVIRSVCFLDFVAEFVLVHHEREDQDFRLWKIIWRWL